MIYWYNTVYMEPLKSREARNCLHVIIILWTRCISWLHQIGYLKNVYNDFGSGLSVLFSLWNVIQWNSFSSCLYGDTRSTALICCTYFKLFPQDFYHMGTGSPVGALGGGHTFSPNPGGCDYLYHNNMWCKTSRNSFEPFMWFSVCVHYRSLCKRLWWPPLWFSKYIYKKCFVFRLWKKMLNENQSRSPPGQCSLKNSRGTI